MRSHDFTLPKNLHAREWHRGGGGWGDRGHLEPSVVQSHFGTAIITSSARVPGIQQKGLEVSLGGKDAHWKSSPPALQIKSELFCFYFFFLLVFHLENFPKIENHLKMFLGLSLL